MSSDDGVVVVTDRGEDLSGDGVVVTAVIDPDEEEALVGVSCGNSEYVL